jgi:hypothetical protein
MRVSFAVLTAFGLLSALPATAQVVVQDQADTFLGERMDYFAKSQTMPEKWWGGDMGDMAAAPAVDLNAGANTDVQPLFSFEDMMGATAQTSDPAANQPAPSLPGGPAPALPGLDNAPDPDAPPTVNTPGLIIPGINDGPLPQAQVSGDEPASPVATEELTASPAPTLPPPEDSANAIDILQQADTEELAPANPTLTP